MCRTDGAACRQSPDNDPVIYRISNVYLTYIYRISIVYLSYIYRISIVYLSCIYRVSIVYLTCIYRRESEKCSKNVREKAQKSTATLLEKTPNERIWDVVPLCNPATVFRYFPKEGLGRSYRHAIGT